MFSPAKYRRFHCLTWIVVDDAEDSECAEVLSELENIDDDCDQKGISFVRIDNSAEAREYGIDDLPGLVYFENGVPSLYDGNSSSLNEPDCHPLQLFSGFVQAS